MAGGGESRTGQKQEFDPATQRVLYPAGTQILEAQQALPLSQFAQARPQAVPGLSPQQQRAISETGGLYDLAGRQGRLSGLERLGMGTTPMLYDLASRRATGAGIESSPSYRAAIQAYERAYQPAIENRAAVAGLGRSTALTNADAAARAAFLQPTIEGELAREERQNQAQFAQTQQAIQQAIASGGLPRAAATQEQNARTQAIQAGLMGGEIARGVETERAAAEQQDFLRRQALAEAATTGVFGQLAPSTIGTTTKTAGSSGLFK
jgi:hypothetical protein